MFTNRHARAIVGSPYFSNSRLRASAKRAAWERFFFTARMASCWRTAGATKTETATVPCRLGAGSAVDRRCSIGADPTETGTGAGVVLPDTSLSFDKPAAKPLD